MRFFFLPVVFVLLLLAVACAPPNLGSNIRGGDLERTQEVWVAADTDGPGKRPDTWHIESTRAKVAEFTRILSTALKAEGEHVLPRGPGGREIYLVIDAVGGYQLFYFNDLLYDFNTEAWYEAPDELPALIDAWRQLPVVERARE